MRIVHEMECRIRSDVATRFIFLLLSRLEQSTVIELQSNTYLFFPPSRVNVCRSREKLKNSNDRRCVLSTDLRFLITCNEL